MRKVKLRRVKKAVSAKPFTCSECGQACVSKMALYAHRSKFHREITSRLRAKVPEEGKVHKCRYCTWTAVSRSAVYRHIAREHPERTRPSRVKEYSCDVCEKRCVSKCALSKHRSNCHRDITSQRRRNIPEEEKVNKCPHCAWKGVERKELNRHVREKHPEHATSPRPFARLNCSACSEKLASQNELWSHYYDTHHYNLEKKTASFKSREVFQTWLKQLKDTRFVQQSQWKKANSDVNVMICDRSGGVTRIESTYRRRSMHLTKKIDYRCTAYLKAETNHETGIVTVEYCLDHIHEVDFSRMGFRDDIKIKILEFLQAGLDSRWIIDTINQCYPSDDSVKYLKAEHVNNLRKKYNIYPEKLDKHDLSSLKMRIEEDAQSSHWQDSFGFQQPEPIDDNIQMTIMPQPTYTQLDIDGDDEFEVATAVEIITQNDENISEKERLLNILQDTIDRVRASDNEEWSDTISKMLMLQKDISVTQLKPQSWRERSGARERSLIGQRNYPVSSQKRTEKGRYAREGQLNQMSSIKAGEAAFTKYCSKCRIASPVEYLVKIDEQYYHDYCFQSILE